MAQARFTTAQIQFIVQKLKASGVTPDPALIDQLLQRTFGSALEDAVIDAMMYGTGTIHTNFGPKSSPQPEQKAPPPVSTELPKQELLLKLLKMTTSSNDGEALTAIRKVNTMLTANGWDWDKFVAGKIKIVENPFVGLGTPHRVDRPTSYTTTPPSAPPTPPPPPPKARYAGQRIRSLGVNRFADHCYCCGIEVFAQAGGFFNPTEYNLNARSPNPKSKFAVVCASCENTALVWDQAAAPIRKRGKTSINDLA